MAVFEERVLLEMLIGEFMLDVASTPATGISGRTERNIDRISLEDSFRHIGCGWRAAGVVEERINVGGWCRCWCRLIDVFKTYVRRGSWKSVGWVRRRSSDWSGDGLIRVE
jgi:hypothetical protein